MQPGRILVAEQEGSNVVKLVGDVRLTLCTVLDDYFEEMFSSENFSSVLVDLTEADNVDSTTLGLLAKLALMAKKRYEFIPVILSTNPDITRVLQSMGFDRVFRIRQFPLNNDQDLGELPQVEGSEGAVKEKVLEAHRVLMGLNDANKAKFRELVSMLEKKC